jgi:hypothetical protein
VNIIINIKVYEEAAAAGKLNSVSIFGGLSLPWTNQQTEDMNKKVSKDMKQARGVAKKVRFYIVNMIDLSKWNRPF